MLKDTPGGKSPPVAGRCSAIGAVSSAIRLPGINPGGFNDRIPFRLQKSQGKHRLLSSSNDCLFPQLNSIRRLDDRYRIAAATRYDISGNLVNVLNAELREKW